MRRELARWRRGAVAGGALLLLAACQSPEHSFIGDDRVNPAGVNTLFPKEFEAIDEAKLARVICPDQGEARLRAAGPAPTMVDAYVCFNRLDEPTRRERRNEVQGWLMAISDNRCQLYATYLTRGHAWSQGTFTVLATILGGAGAIVTGEVAARTLAGLAGVTSGIGSDIDEAVFQQQSATLILNTIRNSRSTAASEIRGRAGDPIHNYPLTQAITDAIRYHQLCSLASGLQNASRAVNVASFGLDQVRIGIGAAQDVRYALDAPALRAQDIRPAQRFVRDDVFYRVDKVENGIVSYSTARPGQDYAAAAPPLPIAQFLALGLRGPVP